MKNNICRVANLITEFQIVLNCGSKDNVKIGSVFEVYALGDMVLDPETREELEINEILKGKGSVIHLQEKICTIESIKIEERRKTVRIKKNPLYQGIFSGISNEDEIREEIVPEKIPFKSVQIGDYARIIKW